MQAFNKLSFSINGLSPHVQHSAKLADPMDPITIALAELTSLSSKKKTLEIRQQIHTLEWMGGLYLNADQRVIVPGFVIEGAMYEAGKAIRKGPQVQGGLRSPGDWLLLYPGPKSLDKLKEDAEYRFTVGVKNPSTKGRLMRTRPIFRQWQLKFDLEYRPDMLSEKDVTRMVNLLGSDIGLSDDRHKMGGRFEVLSYTNGSVH